MLSGYDLSLDNSENLKLAELALKKTRKKDKPAKMFQLAQGGDDEAFVKIYEHYKPYVEYLYFNQAGATIDGIDTEELASAYKLALIESIREFDESEHSSARNLIKRNCLNNLSRMRAKLTKNGRGSVDKFVAMEEKPASVKTRTTDHTSVRVVGGEAEKTLTENYIDRLLSLLGVADRAWLMGYFKYQKLSDYARSLGVSKQNCSWRLKKIEELLLDKKQEVDSASSDYYEAKKNIKQIAKERGITRAEASHLIRLHNYIYNGGQYPEMKSFETSVAECVLTSREFSFFKATKVYSTYSFRNAYNNEYYENVQSATRQVSRAMSKFNVVADCIEDGEGASPLSKQEYEKMNRAEKAFYGAVYAYAIEGDLKPNISDKIKQSLMVANGESESAE